MKPFTHALLALGLISAGILLGRVVTSGANESSISKNQESSLRSRPEVVRNSSKTSPADGHNLTALLARANARVGINEELRSEMERMSPGRLKAIALEHLSVALAHPESEDDSPMILFDAAIAELWRREGTAALEWADRLSGKEERGTATKQLLENALQENPSAALPWMERYQREFGKSATTNEFLYLALNGAANRGADDTIQAFGMFSGANVGNPIYGAQFPEDFDFKKLYSALSDKTDLSNALTQWAQRDPESAWATVKDRLSQKASDSSHSDPVGLIMKAVIGKKGEAAGVSWIMSRISTLPEDQQQEQFKKLAARGDITSEGIRAIATALPPNDRVAYSASVVREAGASPRGYAAIDALPREEQLKALQVNLRGSNSSIGPNPGTPASNAYTEKILKEVQQRYQLSHQEMEAISAVQTR